MKNALTNRSQKRVWVGRIIGALVVAFLVMDGVMKLFKPPFVVEATLKLGYPESTLIGIGIALLACTVLYVVPRTAVFGAILLTGYLGGAVASNVRAQNAAFNTVFPVLIALAIWASLTLRDRPLEEAIFRKE